MEEEHVDENTPHITNTTIEKCQQWLQEKCGISEVASDSECHHLKLGTSSCVSGCDSFYKPHKNSGSEYVKIPFHGESNSYGTTISVSDSKHVVVGNVTYFTGPVHVSQASSTVHEQKVVNQVFLGNSIDTQKSKKLRIIARMNWLAQPALSRIPLSTPVRYIIIAHTATEEAFSQAKNTLLVRLVQTFHIESRDFVDVSYNFLVSSDGLIYEGRGWSVQGEHTHGYNEKSICISFVGCFMTHLPPEKAMQSATALIQQGIELGFIREDYVLCGHCQCLPIESPGRRLYNEIKGWPHWRELTREDSN